MKIFDFTTYSNRFICTMLFIWGSILALRWVYIEKVYMNIASSFLQVLFFRFVTIFWVYIEPIFLVLFLWFLVAALYKFLEK